ncbi:MAG TPA: alpha/beta hydrolase, partial [Terriglobales bacterium]|nr:alpha/beta hydrolase [Terriglobales bacterium]
TDGRWTAKEMGEPGDAAGIALKLRLLPEGQSFPAQFDCEQKPTACEFQLTYFLSEGFDPAKKERLNILYIPGGPGAIVDTTHRSAALRVLERKHNVVYFHPRGAAQSAVDGAKEYDRFLRADYVVDDIEQVRRRVLKDRPWDAIYAHSWGTVIAQRYAAKYGSSSEGTPKVASLILSGPVDRHRPGTQRARAEMTLNNLKRIFAYYRSQAHCTCESSSFLRPLVTDFSDPQISTFGNRLGPSDNFCFLTDAVVEKILKRFESLVAEIDERYGSADFVVDHFATAKSDAVFQKSFDKFPVEFFAAVRYLQMSGAPVKDGLVFVADSRNRVNAALLIAHTLTANSPSRCEAKGEPFGAAAADCEYCERLKAAKDELRAQLGGWESQRASYVYGVYDGVTRWLGAMMNEPGCFTGKDLQAFASGGDDAKKFGREQARKIGVVVDEKICPWNPADFRHEVPTLLLKGSRDTVVAGCQAEDFFTNGLKQGRRVLIEFNGLGHDMSVANLYEGSDPSNWSKTFAGLLEDFMKLAPNVSRFRADVKVKAKLRQLKANDRTQVPDLSATCGQLS